MQNFTHFNYNNNVASWHAHTKELFNPPLYSLTTDFKLPLALLHRHSVHIERRPFINTSTDSNHQYQRMEPRQESVPLAIFSQQFDHIVNEQDEKNARRGRSLSHPHGCCDDGRADDAACDMIHGDQGSQHHCAEPQSPQHAEQSGSRDAVIRLAKIDEHYK